MGQFFSACVTWVIYALSFLVPRDTNLWIFIGWRKNKEREVFAENPKYQFLYTVENRPDIRSVWIGQDPAVCALLRARGYEAYPIKSVHGIYYSLRAGYTFIGGLLQPHHFRYVGCSRVIQLWHSKSLKKTGYESPYGLSRYNRFLSPNLFKEPYRFIAISDFLSVFIENDFHIPKNNILITGIPKHDVLLTHIVGADIDADVTLEALIKEARSHTPNRLLFYGPTFRPDGSNPLENFDLQSFNEHLAQQNDICIISLHPKFSARKWIPQDTHLSHIRFSQSDLDIYPFLPLLDLLITDYSSLCFDFLLMGKPIILYAYDMDTFKVGMGVYDELWEAIPSPKVFTFDALLKTLTQDMSAYHPQIGDAQKKVFTYTDGHSAKRITEYLKPQPTTRPTSALNASP